MQVTVLLHHSLITTCTGLSFFFFVARCAQLGRYLKAQMFCSQMAHVIVQPSPLKKKASPAHVVEGNRCRGSAPPRIYRRRWRSALILAPLLRSTPLPADAAAIACAALSGWGYRARPLPAGHPEHADPRKIPEVFFRYLLLESNNVSTDLLFALYSLHMNFPVVQRFRQVGISVSSLHTD